MGRDTGSWGDVWKHLLLAALLERERPGHYWETHAGVASATYDPARPLLADVADYLERAGRSDLLTGARYTTIARDGLRGGRLETVPGSARIALRILGRTSDYRFADTDPEALRSLRAAALRMRLRPDRVRLHHGDGLRWLGRAQPPASTMVLLDPVHPRDDIGGGDSLRAFNHLGSAGALTCLWYPILDEPCPTRTETIASLRGRVWIGEQRLPTDLVMESGLLGSGLAVVGARETTLSYCEVLGEALGRHMGARFSTEVLS